jgi:hypothetical protein
MRGETGERTTPRQGRRWSSVRFWLSLSLCLAGSVLLELVDFNEPAVSDYTGYVILDPLYLLFLLIPFSALWSVVHLIAYWRTQRLGAVLPLLVALVVFGFYQSGGVRRLLELRAFERNRPLMEQVVAAVQMGQLQPERQPSPARARAAEPRPEGVVVWYSLPPDRAFLSAGGSIAVYQQRGIRYILFFRRHPNGWMDYDGYLYPLDPLDADTPLAPRDAGRPFRTVERLQESWWRVWGYFDI